MWTSEGLLEDWCSRYCWAHSILIWLWLNNFFLQIILIQTWWTYIPRIQTISFSNKLVGNMRLMNSKLDVWCCSPDINPSNLCLTQNQASLTVTHSQKIWTLSCNTPHRVQLGEAVKLNLKTLSLLKGSCLGISSGRITCLASGTSKKCWVQKQDWWVSNSYVDNWILKKHISFLGLGMM